MTLCGASNRRLCDLPWQHDGDHEWTHDGKHFRWRNTGKAVKRSHRGRRRMKPSEAVTAGKCPSCLGEGWVTRVVPVEHVGPCSTCLGTGLWPSPPTESDDE